jgi:hypothetical protein
MRDRITPSGEKQERNRLESSPLSNLSPQERSAQNKRSQEGAIGALASGAVGLATGLAGTRGQGAQQLAPQAIAQAVQQAPQQGQQPAQVLRQQIPQMADQQTQQQANQQQQPVSQDEVSNIEQILTDMLESGENPNAIVNYLRGNYARGVLALETMNGQQLEELIQNYMRNKQKQGNRQSQQQSQGTQQPGQGQQALMEIMQRINQKLGK